MQAQLTEVTRRLTAIESVMARPTAKEGGRPFSDEQVKRLQATIAQCVSEVRASAPSDDNVMARFYAGFDAYFNAATGKVQNNVIYAGGMPAAFAFGRCMSAKGIPLS